MKIKNAVICAAGLGTRLGLNKPKCLVVIKNKPLIHHLLHALEDVPNIRIVVGFNEEEVIKTVKEVRKDVVFVRNPDYRSTTNAYSLYLGSNDLNEPFLNIDGDMYITPDNLRLFDSKITEGENLIGVTQSYTEDAVYVKIDEQDKAVAFSREKISDLEWTGIAYFATIKIKRDGGYVFQELENSLPIPTCKVECFEIDTPADLEIALRKLQ